MTARRNNAAKRRPQSNGADLKHAAPLPTIRPTAKHTLRGLGGRRVVLEGFGPRAPAFIAIAAGGSPPIGAWLSPTELRRLIEAARRILR
jgi:hypothetical protein